MRFFTTLAASTLLLAVPAGAFTIVIDDFETAPVAISAGGGLNTTNSSRSGQVFYSPFDPSSDPFAIAGMEVNVNTQAASSGMNLNISGGTVSATSTSGGVGSFFSLTYSGFSSTFAEPGFLIIPIASTEGEWELEINVNGSGPTHTIVGPDAPEFQVPVTGVDSINDIFIKATLTGADPFSASDTSLVIGALTIIPEPSTALLLLGGLVPLGLHRRRRLASHLSDEYEITQPD